MNSMAFLLFGIPFIFNSQTPNDAVIIAPFGCFGTGKMIQNIHFEYVSSNSGL